MNNNISRTFFESSLGREEAYEKCLSQAQKLGYRIVQTVKGKILRIEETNKTIAWWLAVIFGFLTYVVPGILVLLYWKPVDFCEISFHDSDKEKVGTSITGKYKGDLGRDAYYQLSSIF